jgi:hypothetical protein
MDPADEMAAKIEPTEHQSAGAVAGSIDKLDEQLRVSVEALLHPSPRRNLWRNWMTFFRGSVITSTTRLRSERQFIFVS